MNIEMQTSARCIRRLVAANPTAVLHQRKSDLKAPLHLLCGNKTFIERHEPGVIVHIITAIRSGALNHSKSPSEQYDRAKRLPKDYLQRLKNTEVRCLLYYNADVLLFGN